MKINYHIIIQKNNETISVIPVDVGYEAAQSYVLSLRTVYKEEESYYVFLENVNGEKL